MNRNLIMLLVGIVIFGGVAYASTISDEYISSKDFLFGSNSGNLGETCPNRPLTTNEDTYLEVGPSGDYATIQEAVCKIPLLVRHKYRINVTEGYYNENVYFPPALESGTDSTEGSSSLLKLRGNCSSINDVIINSIQISANVGANFPFVQCMQINGTDPYSDENASITIYSSTQPQIGNINFTANAVAGIMGYSSNFNTNSVFLNGPDNGFFLKRMSTANIGDVDVGVNGTVTGYLVKVGSGYADIVNNNVVSGTGTVNCESKNGFAKENGNLYCVDQLNDDIEALAIKNTDTNLTYFLRQTDYNQYMSLEVDDTKAIFTSEQDEDTGNAGGFTFIVDDDGSASGDFLIDSKSGGDVFRVQDKGPMILGDGVNQKNITMTSPDGTEYSCGVNNGGNFVCG